MFDNDLAAIRKTKVTLTINPLNTRHLCHVVFSFTAVVAVFQS